MTAFLINWYPLLCLLFIASGYGISFWKKKSKKKSPFAAILLLYVILFFSLYAFLQVLHADSVAPFCFTGVMLIDLLFWNEKR